MINHVTSREDAASAVEFMNLLQHAQHADAEVSALLEAIECMMRRNRRQFEQALAEARLSGKSTIRRLFDATRGSGIRAAEADLQTYAPAALQEIEEIESWFTTIENLIGTNATELEIRRVSRCSGLPEISPRIEGADDIFYLIKEGKDDDARTMLATMRSALAVEKGELQAFGKPAQE